MSSSGSAHSTITGNPAANPPETVGNAGYVCASYKFDTKYTMIERLNIALEATTNCRMTLEDVKKDLDALLDPRDEQNHPVPHPDMLQMESARQVLAAYHSSADEESAENLRATGKIANASDLPHDVLMDQINQRLASRNCSVKTMQAYVEQEFRCVYDLIPTTTSWMPSNEMYGRQPGNNSIVMQPPTDDGKKSLRYENVVKMPLLVDGKETDDTVTTVVLTKHAVIPADAFVDAEKKLSQFILAYVQSAAKLPQGKPKEGAKSVVAKALLEEFVRMLTVSLWPERLAIARARQKTFRRTFHLKLFEAVDQFIQRTVDRCVRSPAEKLQTLLKEFFDPTENVMDEQEDLIQYLVADITKYFNNSCSQAREKMWANNLKQFVQDNADVKLTRDCARDFFNYIKNKVLDLEKTIKREEEEDSELPPPAKASKSAKLRELKKKRARHHQQTESPSPADENENHGQQAKREKKE